MQPLHRPANTEEESIVGVLLSVDESPVEGYAIEIQVLTRDEGPSKGAAAHIISQYRVKWKNTGAAKQIESMRSRTPPWPSTSVP